MLQQLSRRGLPDRILRYLPRPIVLAGTGAALTIAGLLVLASSHIGIIDGFEHWTADWRTAFLSRTVRTQHPDLAVVLIDEETLERFGTETRSPTDRALLAALLRVIDGAGPRAIGLDFIFDQKTSRDEELLAALRSAKTPAVLGLAAPPVKLTAKQAAFQAAFLKEAGKSLGYLNIATEFDNVVRLQGEPDEPAQAPMSLAEALAAC
jgi:adenylate cyclase